MGKYGRYEHGRERKQRKWQVHPVWRGIGCLILLLLPIISYAGADVFVTYNSQHQLLPLPGDYYAAMGVKIIEIKDFKFSYPINFDGLKLGVLVFTIAFFFVGLSVYTFLYAAFYRFMAPSRYSALDSPPVGKYRPPIDRSMRR